MIDFATLDRWLIAPAEHEHLEFKGQSRLPQIPINSQTLSIQELLAPVSIGLEAKMIGKNRQKPPLVAAERRKLPLRARKKPKTGHFYPSKVP